MDAMLALATLPAPPPLSTRDDEEWLINTLTLSVKTDIVEPAFLQRIATLVGLVNLAFVQAGPAARHVLGAALSCAATLVK